jgi:hypothetical protein
MKNLITSLVVLMLVASGLAGCQGSKNDQTGFAAPSSSKAITSFWFTSPTATGTVDESAKSIDVVVPPGTNVTGLIAKFIMEGVSVEVGGTAQVSGITPNDFTNPLEYRVFAADGSSITYTVHVNISEKWKIVSSASFGTEHISKVSLSNQRAYVAYGYGGIRILDISDLSHPLLAGSIDSPTLLGQVEFSLYDIVISNNIAYVAAYPNCIGWCVVSVGGAGEIRLYNVENSADPVYLSSVAVGAEDLYADGQYLYATGTDADLTNRLFVIDISAPTNPFIKSSVQIPGAGRLAKNGNFVYVSTNDVTHFQEIIVVDVSDPANPIVVNPSDNTILNVVHAPLTLFNNFGYVADGDYGLTILDISSANTPTTIKTISDLAPATGIAIAGDYLLVTHDSNTTDIYNLQTPQTPVLFKQIMTNTGGRTVFAGDGYGVIVSDEVLQYDGFGYAILDYEKLNFFYY